MSLRNGPAEVFGDKSAALLKGSLGLRGHVEAHISDVAGLVLTDQTLGGVFDFLF